MLTFTVPPTSAPLRVRAVEDVAALRVFLEKELGIPFVFGDLGAEPRLPAGSTDVQILEPGDYQLTLVLPWVGRPSAIATGRFRGLARTADEAHRESVWLAQWFRAVADNWRMSDSYALNAPTPVEPPHDAFMPGQALEQLDRLLRRLRLHRDPTKNIRTILECAFDLVQPESLICVPTLTGAKPLIVGERLLAASECHDLIAALRNDGVHRDEQPMHFEATKNPPWGQRFPAVVSLLAFPLHDNNAVGWLFAVNKKGTCSDAALETAEASAFASEDVLLLAPFAALLRMQCASSSRFQELKELVVGLARSLTAAIDAKDSFTYGHSERVARIALELGRTLDLSGDELSALYLSGLLHDVGKIGVPDAVLHSKEPLTPDAFDAVKQHVTIGYAILADLGPIQHLLPGVLHHHEHWDGSGYPEGLQGEKIPLLARILAVADAYDAMSTDRPYRAALPFAKVEQQLQEGAGSQWDPRIIEAFLKCRHKIHAIRQRGVGESLRHALDGALRHPASTMVV